MRYIYLLLIGALLFLYGCRRGSGVVEPPQEGRGIYATEDGAGIIISWNAVSDCDGYEVITPCGDTVCHLYTTTYRDSYPAATGTYTIFSILGFARIPVDSFSSAPYESEPWIDLFCWGSDDGPSGYGWDTETGIGSTYECIAANKSFIDLFLYKYEYMLHLVAADEPPLNGNRATRIQRMDTTDFFIAPEASYKTGEFAAIGSYFALQFEDGHYAKLHISNGACNTVIVFNYEFQTIRGLRIF
jgi:hypothetical protein